MNSEIKEILDKINCALKIYERDKKLNQVSPKSIYFLSPKEQQILLDYITNLQEEVKSANESITWWTNRFNAIQRDNEKLKELCDKYEEEHSTTFKEWQEIRKEHSIMKQFIYENGLWERFLNDDRLLEHLRSDDNE